MKTFRLILSFLAILAVSGCGGGGGGDDGGAAPPPAGNPSTPTAGIGRTGIAVGPVTTFGSIVVNGVRYDTSSTTFSIDGQPGNESDLRVGDIVIVSGTIDDDGTTGIADNVIYDDAVTGTVDSIDLAGNSIVVLGQTVLIRPETSFDDDIVPASIDGISIGQIVEVSGTVDANGNIVASRIEPRTAGSQFEVHGTVSSLDTTNGRFTLGALTVDYSSATLEDFPGGTISDGDFVEAKGTSFGANGELLATSVEFENEIPDADEGDRLEIEGFITRFASATDFDVAGIPVTTTASTVYENGSAADLGLNVKVEVEGDLNANGVLVAEKVELEFENDVRVTAAIDSVDASAGTVVILGISVTVDASTRIEDNSDAEVEPLTLSDVNAGDFAEVRGQEIEPGSGTIVAARFEREDPDDETALRGFVSAVTEPTLEILGVTIQTNGATQFRDAQNMPISAAEFFATVTEGSLIEATGVESGDTTIIAEEVEFETGD